MTQSTDAGDGAAVHVDFQGLADDDAIDVMAEGLIRSPGGPQRRRELLNLWKHEARRGLAEAGASGPKICTMLDRFFSKIAARAVEMELHGCHLPQWPSCAAELN